jgi:hypothetical protein
MNLELTEEIAVTVILKPDMIIGVEINNKKTLIRIDSIDYGRELLFYTTDKYKNTVLSMKIEMLNSLFLICQY